MLHRIQTWWEGLESIKKVGWLLVAIPIIIMFIPACAVVSNTNIGMIILRPLGCITPIAIAFMFYFGRNNSGLAIAARITLVVYILSMAIIICSQKV